MKQSRTKISRVIADQTLAGGDPKQLSRELAAYLLSERRVSELSSILRDVQADWAEAGHVEVIAASAHPLSAETTSEIECQVKRLLPDAKQIVVVETRDPAVIGGVRLNLANQ